MATPHARFVGLLLASPEEEALWGGVLASQGVPSVALGASIARLDEIGGDSRLASCAAIVADAPLLNARGFAPRALANVLREAFGEVALCVRLPARTGISAPERAWAEHAGIAALLPGSTAAAWQESLAPVLARVLEHAGRPGIDAATLEAALNRMIRAGQEPRPGPVKDAYVDSYYLESAGLNAARMHQAMQDAGGVAVEDRTYRGKTYRQCFVASDAVDWMVARFGLRRPAATRVCSFLWRTGRIHHVLREAAFEDDLLYFRFGGTRADLDGVDLVEAEAGLRSEGGVAIAERTYLAKAYPRSFVGSDAVDWLRARHRLPLGAAETVGQRLLELGVFHHVTDDHGFSDGRFFYRFRADEVALAA
jgi:DEP domain-containing protein